MITVILGPDAALARRALAEVLRELGASDLSTDRLDSNATSAEALLAAVTAAPFFGDRRTVVVEGLIDSSNQKASKTSRRAEGADLGRLLSSKPPSTNLILYSPNVGSLTAAVRRSIPDDADIRISACPRGHQLVRLAQSLAQEHGAEIAERDARLLLNRLFPGDWQDVSSNPAFDRPPSIELLENELAKLALAAYPNAITEETIEHSTPSRAADRMFPLLDAAIRGDRMAALGELTSTLRSGEEPARVLAQVYQQIELSVGAVASGRPSNGPDAAKALGITSSYRFGKLAEAVARGKRSPLEQLRLALEVDRRLKTGVLRTPEDALTSIVIASTRTENRR